MAKNSENSKELQDVSEIKKEKAPVKSKCPRCKGTGSVPNAMYGEKGAVCPRCGCTGEVRNLS